MCVCGSFTLLRFSFESNHRFVNSCGDEPSAPTKCVFLWRKSRPIVVVRVRDRCCFTLSSTTALIVENGTAALRCVRHFVVGVFGVVQGV